MTRLFVNGPIHPSALARIAEQGSIDIDHSETILTGSAFNKRLHHAHIVIIHSQPQISAKLLHDQPHLRAIVRLGVGTDHIDLDAAQECNVAVEITIGENITSVAEHTLGLILALSHKIAECDQRMKKQQWARDLAAGQMIKGKKLGIVGFGRVGSTLARLAEPFGMRLFMYDPYVSTTPPAVLKIARLDELASQVDILSLHVPLTAETRALISADILGRLPAHALLINTSRGPVIDEGALLNELDLGAIAGAGLDVMCGEPSPHPKLMSHPRVVATPHSAGLTAEAQHSISMRAAELTISHAEKHSQDERDQGTPCPQQSL